MPGRRRLALYACALSGLFAIGDSAQGATLVWDANGIESQIVDGPGNWDLATANWWNGSENQAWTDSTLETPVFAQFGNDTTDSNKTVALDGTYQVAGLIFGPLGGTLSSSNSGYTLTGGTIQINDGGTITLGDRSSASGASTYPTTINSTLAGRDVTIQSSSSTGGRFLYLGGANQWGGTLTIASGPDQPAMFVRSAGSDVVSTLDRVAVEAGNTFVLAGSIGVGYFPAFTVSGDGAEGRGALRFDSNDLQLLGKVTLAGDATLTFEDGSHAPINVTFFDGIDEQGGSSAFTKRGAGSLTLLEPSTYTGATKVETSTWSADPGTLILNFALQASDEPYANLLYHGVAPGSEGQLILAGNSNRGRKESTATLQVVSAAGGVNSQTFGGVSVTGPTAIIAESFEAGEMNLNLGAITRSGMGTTLAFTGPAIGSITTTNPAGMLGTWSSFYNPNTRTSSWAGANSDGVLGNFLGDTTYTTAANLGSYAGTANLVIDGSSTATVVQTSMPAAVNTLTMRDQGSDRVIAIGAGQTLALGQTGGIQLISGSRNLTVGSSKNEGTLTAGTEANAELFLSNFNAQTRIVINSVIADNPDGAVNVVVNGPVDPRQGGASTTVFNGNNTYTGRTTVASGILRITTNDGLGSLEAGTIVGAGGQLQLEGGLTVAESIGIGGTGIFGDGAIRAISGSNTLTGTITLNSALNGAGPSIHADSGASLTLAPASGVAVTGTESDMGFNGAGTIIVNGDIATGAGVTKSGPGLLVLNSANTYSEATRVTGGVLRITNEKSLGTSAGGVTISSDAALQMTNGLTITDEALTIGGRGIYFGGGLRGIGGDNAWAGNITLGGQAAVGADLGSSLTLGTGTAHRISASSRDLYIEGMGDIFINSTIDGTGAFLLAGGGTVHLGGNDLLADTGFLGVRHGNLDMGSSSDAVGALSMWRGAITGTGTLTAESFSLGEGRVTVNLAEKTAGTALNKNSSRTLILSGQNSYTGATVINDGRLVADYSGGGNPLGNSSAITMGGGSLELKGAGGTAETPVTIPLGPLNVDSYSGLSTLAVGANTQAVFSSYSRASASALLVDLSAPGSSAVIPNLSYVTVKDGNGHYDFAALGEGNVVQRLGATTSLLAGTDTVDTALVGDDLTTTLAADVRANSLRIDANDAGGVLDLGGKRVVLNSYNLLIDGSNDFLITNTGTVGGLTGRSNTAVFLYHYGTGRLTLDANVLSTQTNLLGSGLIDWTASTGSAGPNAIYGPTVRMSGTAFVLSDGATGAGAGLLRIGNGGIIELTNADFTRGLTTNANATGKVIFYSTSGFSAYGADRTVNIGNDGQTLTWWSSTNNGFLRVGSALILGSKYADHTVKLANGLNLNNNSQFIDVQSVNQPGIGGEVAGVIQGSGFLTKTGQGILTLSAENTYTAHTRVAEGTLSVTGSINGSLSVNVESGAELKVAEAGRVVTGAMNLADNSTLSLELGATPEAASISLYDNLGMDGEIKLTLDLTEALMDGTIYTLIDATRALSGGGLFSYQGALLSEGTIFTVAGGTITEQMRISYFGGTDGFDVTLEVLAVPEPGTWAALCASVGLLLGLSRFRGRRDFATAKPAA